MKVLHIIWENLWDMRGGLLGSLVYSTYAHVFLNRPLLKNILSFFVGVICSVYLADPVHSWFPNTKLEMISFVMGLTGMKIVETLFEIPWKDIITNRLKK